MFVHLPRVVRVTRVVATDREALARHEVGGRGVLRLARLRAEVRERRARRAREEDAHDRPGRVGHDARRRDEPVLARDPDVRRVVHEEGARGPHPLDDEHVERVLARVHGRQRRVVALPVESLVHAPRSACRARSTSPRAADGPAAAPDAAPRRVRARKTPSRRSVVDATTRARWAGRRSRVCWWSPWRRGHGATSVVRSTRSVTTDARAPPSRRGVGTKERRHSDTSLTDGGSPKKNFGGQARARTPTSLPSPSPLLRQRPLDVHVTVSVRLCV